MKFLADESLDRQIVERLRREGHEVLYVAEMAPGVSDDGVLNLANREKALLITADKDFGELVFRQSRLTLGVILIRLAGLPSENKAKLVASAVGGHATQLADAFAVITPGIIRIRRKSHD